MLLDVQDRLYLADGVTRSRDHTALQDESLGSTHQLNTTASLLVAMIDKPAGASVLDLVDALTDSCSVDPVDAREDTFSLIHELDAQALLVIRRPLRVRLAPTQVFKDVVDLALGGSDARPVRRFPATAFGILRATLHMLLLPLAMLAALQLFFFFALASFQPLATTLWRVEATLYLTFLVFSLVATLWAHEYGHALVLRMSGDHSAFAVVRGLRLGIVHRESQALPLSRLAVSGPVLAALTGLSLWPLANLSWMPLEAMNVAPLIGLAHLVSLAPWAADGRMLFKSLQSRFGGSHA